jgi:hypothetical protein
MHIKTSGVFGFLLVRSLAWLRPLRPFSYRYHEEQELIERWLALVSDAAGAMRRLRSRWRTAPASSRATARPTGAARRTSSPSSTRWSRTPRRPTPRAGGGHPQGPRGGAGRPEGKHLGQALGKPVVWLKPVART